LDHILRGTPLLVVAICRPEQDLRRSLHCSSLAAHCQRHCSGSRPRSSANERADLDLLGCIRRS